MLMDRACAARTWTGLAGRMALSDHRNAAEAGRHVLADPALWGAHHDLTGPAPMSWPEALELLCPRPCLLQRSRQGGHVAAWEEPALFSAEVRAAFRLPR